MKVSSTTPLPEKDFKAVIELTEKLREFSPDDPVKYDFAMFAFGVELNRVIKG